jgi:nucleoid-associated protein YgaU
MALTKKPARAASIDAFIQGAPDAAQATAAAPAAAVAKPAAPIAEPAPKASRKQGISVTIQPALLAQLDDTANRMGLSRAAAISLAVSRLVASEGSAK